MGNLWCVFKYKALTPAPPFIGNRRFSVLAIVVIPKYSWKRRSMPKGFVKINVKRLVTQIDRNCENASKINTGMDRENTF